MRKRAMFVFGCVAGLLTVAPSTAQAQDFKRVHVTLGGGWTAPQSDVADRFGQGYNINFGVDVSVNPVVSIEGLYSFNGLGEKTIQLDVADQPGGPTTLRDFSANMNAQYGTVSAVFQGSHGGVRPFGLVGMGVYYRPAEITTPGAGYVPGYCNPWWYVCYPGGWVEVQNVVGDRSSTDFGMVFGGGVRFGAFYAELRYNYIWGPEIEGLDRSELPDLPNVPTSSLVGKKANGQFLQTTFGFRF
jgi:opacity protein-like surface antigen